MKYASAAYKEAMNKMIRNRSFMVVSVGVITAEAQSSAKITGATAYFSNQTNVFKQKVIGNTYATLEENQFIADGSLIFPPVQTGFEQITFDVGCVSKELMGDITIQFDKAYDIKGFTMDFGVFYPTKFKLIVNGADEIDYENGTNEFTTTDSFNKAKSITISPVHFLNGDKKRLRINSILTGIGLVFQNEDIQTANFTEAVSFTSEELPQIDFSLTIFDRNNLFAIGNTSSFINYLETGQEIKTKVGLELDDGSVEWIQLPKTYLGTWSSYRNQAVLTATDRFAYLDEKYTAGNYNHTRTLYADAVAVLSASGITSSEYVIEDSLKNISVVNPLPASTYAECLQLIANAGRCTLSQGIDGEIVIRANYENIVDPADIEVATDDAAAWSKPQNIVDGADVIYEDMTKDFFVATGNMYFMPEDGADYLDTGFVSREIADAEGLFDDNPILSITLPATYTYYGLTVTFAGNAPKEMIVRSYNDDVLISENTFAISDLKCYISNAFYNFDKLEIEITKGAAYNRVLINKFALGSITEYKLRSADMMEYPRGNVEKKTKSVSVKVFTYQEPEAGSDVPQEVQDDVYSTVEINPTGTNITFENQLISTEALANDVAVWLGNYYANNVTYNVNFRGEPRIDAADYIYMETEFTENLQAEVESSTLSFNGALSGSLELRKAEREING